MWRNQIWRNRGVTGVTIRGVTMWRNRIWRNRGVTGVTIYGVTMWYNRSLGCVRLCVCVCTRVYVCDVLTALSVLERSYVVRSSNCCVYVSVAARLCFVLGV